jgi:hypothetical protein
MTKLTLGTSGFVYKTTRKGEDLAYKLSQSELGQSLNLVASGHGWQGFKTKLYDWDEIQDFYKSLDVYLSTSVVEGLGYGVLEALACGVPVIVPKDVGIYDELGWGTGIFRYNKGDFEDMCLCIELCIQMINSGFFEFDDGRDKLRTLTNRFTSEAWVNDHLNAFEELLYTIPESKNKGDLNGKMGIYYVSYGQPAKECFKRALNGVRKHLGDIPVCLVSDAKVESEHDYIFIEYPDNDIGARGNKTLIYELAPKEWEYVVYMDSDTEVISPDVMFLFDLLKDGWELVFCTNPSDYALVKEMNRPDNQDEMEELVELLGTDDLLQYNGGLFAMRRCENTQKILNGWHEQWKVYAKRDQAALDRSLYSNPIRIYTLGVEWNTVTRYYKAERSAGVLHFPMMARRYVGKVPGRLDSEEAWKYIHATNTEK